MKNPDEELSVNRQEKKFNARTFRTHATHRATTFPHNTPNPQFTFPFSKTLPKTNESLFRCIDAFLKRIEKARPPRRCGRRIASILTNLLSHQKEKNMKTSFKFVVVALGAIAMMVACKKDDSSSDGSSTSNMQVKMVDAPSPYSFEEVNVDVRGIDANITSMATGQSQWVTMTSEARVYNLLSLANGIEALIGQATVNAGTLTQVRLHLGPHNSVKSMDGVTHNMDLAPGAETVLVNVNNEQVIAGHTFALFLDFDAAASVVNRGNGWELDPHLRAFTVASTGTVRGKVNLNLPGIAVRLENSEHVYMTYADRNVGNFMLRGAEAGTYTLKVYANNSDVPVIRTNVEVTAGNITDVGLIELQ